jgi:hypothetical protein
LGYQGAFASERPATGNSRCQLDPGTSASWIQEPLPVEGQPLEGAVANWIKESLPVEGKALATAVASWIKESCYLN